MAGRFSEKCKVTVSADSMKAMLFIEPPEDGIAYSVEELTDFVKAKGVYGGIIFSELENMTQNNIYYADHVFAKGQLPEEGSDGYYEIFFDDEKKKKPAIRSDGSVDYQSMSEIKCVSVGDRLAIYHKAQLGKNGYDVRGRALRTKPAKELPVLKGKGFDYNDETGEYTSALEGRVEYDGKTLKIVDVYEHKGDVDLVVGKIDFKGDVVIKGNVLAGTFIRATKSITIEGSVEAATLISGGDIILKKGMQGGKKARISCGGDLYANFIEFTQADVKGKIEANIIMNSQITAGGDVVISGRRGAVVGGSTYAVGAINTTLLGNAAGHKTIAQVGATKELKDRQKLLLTKISRLKKSIETTKQQVVRVSDPRLNKEPDDVRKAKTAQLNRRILKDEQLVTKIEAELERMGYTIAVSKRSQISVEGTAHIGSTIIVDDLTMDINSEIKNTIFHKDSNGDAIEMLPAK